MDILLRQAVHFDGVSIDKEDEGEGGEVADKEYNDNGDNNINSDIDASETQSLFLLLLTPPLAATDDVITEDEADMGEEE